MPSQTISLTAGMRNTLYLLQGTEALTERTNERLATGKKVNSALDDPVAYFAAKAHTDRANDLQILKDNMSEGIQTIESADSGIEAITGLIEQAESIINSARTAEAADITGLQDQWTELLSQIDDLAADASYKGVNLLSGDTLTVEFEGTHKLDVVGFDASSTGLALSAVTDFTDPAELDTKAAEIDAALSALRTNAQTLSSNLSIVDTRENFTTEMINNLLVGSDNLTLADMNEEGANMLMLETRQELGTTSLSMASDAAQSVIKLFQ